MDVRHYVSVLDNHAQANNRPYEAALSDFLDFLLDFCTVDAFRGDVVNYAKHVRTMADKSQDFTALCLQWLSDVADNMDRGRFLDAFGTIYEDMYLTPGKAAKTGQFFTPDDVAALCASILDNGADSGTVNDPTAGSGRQLLAHYIEKSKHDHQAGRRFYYVAQDNDPVVCKMCALNMMAHGMAGRVECRDTLRMSTPTVVYVINEVRYPISSPYYSIRTVLPDTQEAAK